MLGLKQSVHNSMSHNTTNTLHEPSEYCYIPLLHVSLLQIMIGEQVLTGENLVLNVLLSTLSWQRLANISVPQCSNEGTACS